MAETAPRTAQTIEVFADWSTLNGPQRVGVLFVEPLRGKELFSFEHDPSWLGAGHLELLDPALKPLKGRQFPLKGRQCFGAFLDLAPDRWGRVLLDRREAHQARGEKRKPRRLMESDYLLGVFDGHRMGGLRLRHPGGPFLDDDPLLASPPWTSLRELESVSLRLEEAGADRNPRYGSWLKMLIAPGKSLGGARPKAGVLDEKGRLWIAKFPSQNDDRNVGAWELVLHQLATSAGVKIAEAKAVRFASKHHTFLTLRFDREARGRRLHFASAMTMLGRADGDEGTSYLEIAAFLIRQGAQPEIDLEELWRRMVFNVGVSNADDHLRNHGFLLEPKGWVLAPAYDLNPVASANGLTLNLSETDNAQDLDLLREVAPHFRVKKARRDELMDKVLKAIRGWRKRATALGIPRHEQEQMSEAFRIADQT
jgi:serine/threonine-protein kinase HipA